MKKFIIVPVLALSFIFAGTAHAGFFDWFKNTPLNQEAQVISASKNKETINTQVNYEKTESKQTFDKSIVYGEKSDEVTKLQQVLSAAGHLSGSIDGKFGSATQKALKKFQNDNGITANGLSVGSKTRGALNAIAKTLPNLTVSQNVPLRKCLPADEPWIQITSPSGGEVYSEGDVIPVKWRTCHTPSIVELWVDIHFVTEQDFVTVSGIMTNTGSFNYTIPNGFLSSQEWQTGNYYQVHIKSGAVPYNGDYVTVEGFSNSLFTINGNGGPMTECGDGIDNNNNGLIDYPQDPGCSFVGDNSEGQTLSCLSIDPYYKIYAYPQNGSEGVWRLDNNEDHLIMNVLIENDTGCVMKVSKIQVVVLPPDNVPSMSGTIVLEEGGIGSGDFIGSASAPFNSQTKLVTINLGNSPMLIQPYSIGFPNGWFDIRLNDVNFTIPPSNSNAVNATSIGVYDIVYTLSDSQGNSIPGTDWWDGTAWSRTLTLRP